MIELALDEALPHDDEAERALLADVLADNSRLAYFCQHADESIFYRTSHRHIATAYRGLHDEGIPVDLITVKNWLDRTGHLHDLSIPPAADGLKKYPKGAPYLASLLDGWHKGANIEGHLRAVESLADRREFISFAHMAGNGSPDEDVRERFAQIGERILRRRDLPRPLDLARVEPTYPEYIVPGFIRKAALHLAWAPPGGLKTYTMLRAMLELLMRHPRPTLFDHPDLAIPKEGGLYHVLWIGTEEDAGLLSARQTRVLRGLGDPELKGELMHLWASESGRRITLDDLPAIIRRDGPFDAIVLDSLTGLRPKIVEGRRISWDADNDQANEACLALRSLTREHGVAIFILHHTGRDVARGYRGPTDWWASADIQFGLKPEGDRIKVVPEKNREGRNLDPFYLVREFAPGSFKLTYDSSAPKVTLSDAAAKVDAYLRAKGRASQADLIKGSGVSRASVQRAAELCVSNGLWRDTGEESKGSPIFVPVNAKGEADA